MQRSAFEGVESKQTSESIPTGRFDTDVTREMVNDAITRCVWPDPTRKGGIFTAAEIALVCGMHERTAYRKLVGDSIFEDIDIVKVFMASLRRGGSPLTELMMKGFTHSPLPETTLETIDQEMAEEMEAEGDVRKAVASGDKTKAMKALDRAKRVLAKEEATIARMGAKR